MIKKIHIENYKSIPSLEMELGRVNVLIGENGCGKTNILEAIALGSAAESGAMDDEYLAARGVRLTEPRLMRSGFENANLEKDVVFTFFIDGHPFPNPKEFKRYISNNNKPFSPWKLSRYTTDGEISFVEESELPFKQKPRLPHLSVFNIKDFRIYAPENYFLRRFEDDAQNKPLGIRGEGLFKLIATIGSEKPDQLNEIREYLSLIDWFEDFEIPENLAFTERRIRIRDRFLAEGLEYFDQRSSNEGFLYLLFYVTLMVSDYTPSFFAIDNIDNSLNPRLCSKLIEVLAHLSEKHGKQVILTTHNPAILDGLNLNDDGQRLFVISRNKLGHTKALRIEKKPSMNGHEPVKLSEQFLRGYIGGLPKNF